jgi:hypothetical protein
MNTILNVSGQLEYLLDDRTRKPIPPWAKYLINLGGWVAGRAVQDPPLVVTAAVPTRSFAACLSAFGVIVRRAVDPNQVLTVKEHFARLLKLRPDTPVDVQRGEHILEGVLVGITDPDIEGRRFVKVAVTDREGGNEQHLVPEYHAYRVQLGRTNRKLTAKPRSKRAMKRSRFAAECLGPGPALRLEERSRADCILRGTRALIEAEIVQQRFSVGGGKPGPLIEILRPKPFLPPQATHRSVVLTINQDHKQVTQGPLPPVLVFDGALSFLRGRPRTVALNWIVVLDRSEPRFDDALDSILDQSHRFGTLISVPADLGPPPPGLELLIFEA